jgi:YVTN family beta-propeller protein
MRNKAYVGVAIAAILLVSLVAGFYLLLPRGGSHTTTSTSSSPVATSTSTQASLESFGRPIATLNVGSAPYGMAYDPTTQRAFVAVSGAETVAIVDNKSKVTGTIRLSGSADFLGYDPSGSLLYAPLIGNSSIAIVNTTASVITANVAVDTSPGWAAYDPASATVYLVDREANSVWVLSGTTVVNSISLSGLPFAVAYDPSDHQMYVTDNSGAVFIINGTTNSIEGTLQVGGAGSNLLGIAYCPSDHRMYVTSFTDNEVYIIDGSQVTGSIKGFDNPIGIAFRANSSEMYVVNSGNATVSAWLDGQSATAPVGADPREILFDPSIGDILVSNYGDTTLSVISG